MRSVWAERQHARSSARRGASNSSARRGLRQGALAVGSQGRRGQHPAARRVQQLGAEGPKVGHATSGVAGEARAAEAREGLPV
jgi:uncharacterized protein YoaH (UPF0181 family)